jgi:hypothetical protein
MDAKKFATVVEFGMAMLVPTLSMISALAYCVYVFAK